MSLNLFGLHWKRGAMKTTREATRIKEIDRTLAKTKKRFRKVCYAWAQVDAERNALKRKIAALESERDALAQGQLMFPASR